MIDGIITDDEWQNICLFKEVTDTFKQEGKRINETIFR